jgi:hypothetical protein
MVILRRLLQIGEDRSGFYSYTPVVGATFWDPAHFFMERKMLKTIKRLAETTS